MGNTQDDNEFAHALQATNATSPGFHLLGISMCQMFGTYYHTEVSKQLFQGGIFWYFRLADEEMGSKRRDLLKVTE